MAVDYTIRGATTEGDFAIRSMTVLVLGDLSLVHIHLRPWLDCWQALRLDGGLWGGCFLDSTGHITYPDRRFNIIITYSMS